VKIDIEDSGTVTIFAPNSTVAAATVEHINTLTAEAEVGKIYQGTVVKVVDFGAFVEILPGVDGLVHISELANKRVAKVTDVVNEGDTIPVKVLEINQQGKIRLSLKAALAEQE
ncbi:MAG: S1 RNA-binding domain-containing protein, partial [Deltaproteobacteria bacterium]